MFCPKCGEILNKGTDICPLCGFQFKENSTDIQDSTVIDNVSSAEKNYFKRIRSKLSYKIFGIVTFPFNLVTLAPIVYYSFFEGQRVLLCLFSFLYAVILVIAYFIMLPIIFSDNNNQKTITTNAIADLGHIFGLMLIIWTIALFIIHW